MDIFRFEYFEQQRALNRKVYPATSWEAIRRAWDALPEDRKSTYEQEAALGITQGDRNQNQAVAALPPSVGDQPPPGEALAGAISVLHGDLAISLAAHGEVHQLVGNELSRLPTSTHPMSSRTFEAGLLNGTSGKVSVKATATAFDTLHTQTAKDC